MTTDIVWNPYPIDLYVREYNGQALGIGVNSAFQIQGVWNIYSLVCEDLAFGKDYSGDPGDYPVFSGTLPVAAGASFQQMPGTPQSLGELASSMSPSAFLDAIKDFKFFLPRFLMGEENFWTLIERRLTELSIARGNLVFVDFNARRRVQ